jgi:integrase/recombinase XerC
MNTALATLPAATIPICTTDAILQAWLAGRNASTLAAYRADMVDFARFLHVSSEWAAAEALVRCDHGTANRVVLGYRASMTERGLSAATIGRRLAALRSMVKIARTIGRITWSLDVESPRSESYRDTRGPGPDGWKKLVGEAKADASTPDGKRDLALIRLMHDCGLRRGECVALDLVDVDEGTVAIVGKGHTEKTRVTLSRPAREALAAWLAVRGDEAGPLFVRLDRASGGGLQRLTGHSVGRMVRDLGKDAGLTRSVRAHGLRHQGITRALDLTGGDVRKVQRFSRHAKLETLMRYDDARRDDAGQLARLLGEDD